MAADLDLANLRALCDAATAGPWRASGYEVFTVSDGGQGHPLDRYLDSKDVVIEQCEECGNRDVGILHEPDAAFIAAARSALPRLLDECERLRADRDRATAACAQRQCSLQSQRLRDAEDECERLTKDNAWLRSGHWADCAINHGGSECDMGPECGLRPETRAEIAALRKLLAEACGYAEQQDGRDEVVERIAAIRREGGVE